MLNGGLATRAILFTDMVNSTEIRSPLGEERADGLRRVHDGLIGTVVAKHGGTVLRWTGDGVKASFPTASVAVAAALAMVRAVRAYARRSDAIAGFETRVGLSVGEVSADDGDEHGVAGEHEAAEAALDRCATPPLDYLWLSTQQAIAELAAGLGRVARCAQLFEELLPFRGQLGFASSGSACSGLVSRTLGELARQCLPVGSSIAPAPQQIEQARER